MKTAEQAIEDGRRDALEHGRNVLLYVVAPWCPWCRRFETFAADERVRAILEKTFTPVRIDIEEMPDGKEQAVRLRGRDAGIPWYAVLDGSGAVLASSDGPAGNIGFPTDAEEFDRLQELLRQTPGGIPEEDLDGLVDLVAVM